MPNRFDVFLHDTPMKAPFASADRRRSHGCVRIENPRMPVAMLPQKGPEAGSGAAAGAGVETTMTATAASVANICPGERIGENL
jgi:murein L,D-transpeptidase YcbB/YkuD